LGSIDKALPHAGFYPDSQNIHSDAAKIDIISESSKKKAKFLSVFLYIRSFLSLFSKKNRKKRLSIEIFLYFCAVNSANVVVLTKPTIKYGSWGQALDPTQVNCLSP